MNGYEKNPGEKGARISGTGRTQFGSDMQLAIGGCRVSWDDGVKSGDSVLVNITISDRFDFEKKEKGERSRSEEFLTTLGRLANMKETDITVIITATFMKNEYGQQYFKTFKKKRRKYFF